MRRDPLRPRCRYQLIDFAAPRGSRRLLVGAVRAPATRPRASCTAPGRTLGRMVGWAEVVASLHRGNGYRGGMTALGRTDLDVFGICLGGNVFGWTADEPQSHAILDAYTSAGGNFIDTANSYLVEHGRSETIIGRWIAARKNRDQIVLATKVGGGHGAVRNLRADTIEREAHASLERLQTDRIDLYYAHFDDQETALEESLRAFDALVKAGTVRHIGASNYTRAAARRGTRFPAHAWACRVHGPATALQPRRARL